jgi:hypothetical protein
MRERDHLKDQGIDESIMKYIFKKWDGGHWLDLSGLR